MSTTHSALNPDRLIWLPLLAVMAVALIADQARANLHQQARAAVAATAPLDAPLTAEAWCRMHLEFLTGDEAPGFDRGLGGGFGPSSAFSGALPVSMSLPDDRRSRSVDASL